MMRNIAILLYTFLFALLQLGVTIAVHHCGKKVSYNVLGIELGKDCHCPADHHHQHNNGCCHDEKVVLKANTDAVTTHHIYLSLAHTDLVALPAAPVLDFTLFAAPADDFTLLSTDAPPGIPGKIFLRHRVLLI